jgi:hypothetical protein
VAAGEEKESAALAGWEVGDALEELVGVDRRFEGVAAVELFPVRDLLEVRVVLLDPREAPGHSDGDGAKPAERRRAVRLAAQELQPGEGWRRFAKSSSLPTRLTDPVAPPRRDKPESVGRGTSTQFARKGPDAAANSLRQASDETEPPGSSSAARSSGASVSCSSIAIARS